MVFPYNGVPYASLDFRGDSLSGQDAWARRDPSNTAEQVTKCT